MKFIGIVYLVVIFLGAFFSSTGLLLTVEKKTELFRSALLKKIKEENIEKFCTLIGSGLVILGIAISLSVVFLWITKSYFYLLIALAGIVISAVLFIYGNSKFKK